MTHRMSEMTSRERMRTAMTNHQPDRVPVAPDMSNMIPCRLTGKPFWEIYYFADPPLWRAYIEAVKYFGTDGWFIDGSMQYQWPGERFSAVEELQKQSDRWTATTRARIDDEHYSYETVYWADNPPDRSRKPVEDFNRQWRLIQKMYQPPVGYNPSLLEIQRKELGELGAFGFSIGYPGFHAWLDLFAGGVQEMSYLYMDHPDRILELRELHEKQVIKQMEMVLEIRPDFVLLSASGTLTLSSPRIARELSLPSIQKLTRLAKEAGVPTMLHSCGREKLLVKWCAEETDLSCINPLEIAPMGDCDLAEVKQLYGQKLALMGNLHTTEVMLQGTPSQVEEAAKAAIDAAASGGGFILSTGDQCGRDTPDENIFKLVEVAKTYGCY